jgi:hypothetical protein
MSHYTLCAVAQLETSTQNKFEELCKSNQDYVVDFFTKKLEKPLSKFDINNNETGKFDAYGIMDVISTKEMLSDFENWDKIPQAILLPNLEWIECEEWFYSVSEENQKDYDKWVNKIKEVLSKYPSSLAILIDCHI